MKDIWMNATFETNMKCESCYKKVESIFDNLSGVVKWESDLSHPNKLLKVAVTDETLTEEIINSLADVGIDAKLRRDSTNSNSTPFQLSKYKPLFLILVYVVGVSFLFEYAGNDWSWISFSRKFMGFFFFAFAFFKLLDVSKFADAFAMYDLLAMRSRIYGLAYPWVEVSLGIMFVTGTFLFAANLITITIMSFGLIGVMSAVRKKQSIQCACLGTVFDLPMSRITIIENSAMIICALVMLVNGFVVGLSV